MQKIKRIGDGFLFGGIIFLLFLVLFEQLLHIPSWLAVAGRMHPMFLHFPIVLLLIAFFTTWIPANKGADNEWLGLLRLFAALSAVITAIMGMMLSMEEERSGNVLFLHKWGGIFIAVTGFLFYTYYNQLVKRIFVTRAVTLIATIAIILTGHWGADLTHGNDYILAPIKKDQTIPPDQAIVFNDIIKPILDKKCTGCHGEASIKGGLLLETVPGLLAGGKTGPLFQPGKPEVSLLITRIHLPVEDKKRMPPASKPQLTATEAALLSAWVKSGAITYKKLFSLPEKDSFRILATNYLAPGKQMNNNQPVYDFPAADEKRIASLNNNYRVVEPLGEKSAALSVTFFGRSVYSLKALEELLEVKQQVVELSLARMPVKDEDIKVIAQLSNLQKLNLNYTDVTDKGVEQLIVLKKLQELTISGTGVTAASLDKILILPALTSVFVWDTKIDSVQLNAVRNKNPKVHVESGYVDKGDVIVALSPPIVKTPAGIFDKAISLEIKHPFKGVVIRYTLDGTQPDSTSGNIYSGPVNIDKNTTIIAKAFKKGWYGSAPVQASFIKRGIKPDSILLATEPDPKYKPSSTGILSDGVLGDYTNLSSGEWLGYRKNEAAYYIFFNNEISAKNVLLTMVQNTGGYIFPPVKLEVWGGETKDKMKLLGKSTPPIPGRDDPSGQIQEEINFAPLNVKCLKVVAEPIRSLPAWHSGKGETGWVFISEIVVN